MAEQARRTLVDADYVVKGLKREAECKDEGSSQSARVSALSWLGKHLAMFTERHEHTIISEDDIDAAVAAELEGVAGRGEGAVPPETAAAEGPD